MIGQVYQPQLDDPPQRHVDSFIGVGDVVSADYGGDTISMFLNHPTGFAPRLSSSAYYYPHAMSLADMNGDGFLDVVVTNYGRHMVDQIFADGMSLTG